GPIGVYLGAYLAKGLAAVNTFRPLIFAIIIPLAYPFMVPLGLHWPLNAVMLLNIQTLGYDYIQGPMGAWNFACFGATAGVLALSVRNHEETMRQTAVGALAAGLLGGISEPSLYGIHLRYKRIYPSMLVGCLVGGIIIGIGGGLHTQAFIFTSLLTIPAFDKIGLYCVAIAASFVVSGLLVFFRGYQDPQTVSADGTAGVTIPAAATPVSVGASTGTGEVSDAETSAAVSSADQTTPGTATPADVPMGHGSTESTSPDADQAPIQITSPLAGRALPIEEVPDPVFSTGVVGQGIAIDPTSTAVVAPAAGTVLTAPDSGHALGLKLDNGVELLIHIGIDTVELDGKGFDVHVHAGEAFRAGQPLVTFDPQIIEKAGYSNITPVLVTNGFAFTTVEGHPADTVTTESQVITVTR
ncbi:MAG: glucose PTS transporter subunit IIA, partial [Cutibacterium granulosum]|nr:glucose PTS transporter subunit IIA [Cutibacterium granulosum]